jgi:hypothetical protein
MNANRYVFKKVAGTPFGTSLLVFLIFQIVFLIFARFIWTPWREKLPQWLTSRGIEQAQTAFLLLCVYLLVAVNTVIFIVDLYPEIAAVHKIATLNENDKKNVWNRFKHFSLFLILGVFLSGGMIALVCNSFCVTFSSEEYWRKLLEANHLFSVILFSFFLYADICCVKACTIALSQQKIDAEDKKRLEKLKGKLKLYALACDGPALLGIVLICIVSLALNHIVAGFYWQGFVAGAIGLQIAFSQTVLALLSLLEEPV